MYKTNNYELYTCVFIVISVLLDCEQTILKCINNVSESYFFKTRAINAI